MGTEKAVTGLVAILLLGSALMPALGESRGPAAVLGLVALAAEVVLLAPGVPLALWAKVVCELTRVRGAGRERQVLKLARASLDGDPARCLALCQALDGELERRRNGDLLRACRSLTGAAQLALGRQAAALDSLRAARRLGPLTPDAAAALARLHAVLRHADEEAVTAYLEHVKSASHASERVVVDVLHDICQVGERAGDDLLALNRRVADAAPHLAWAHANVGLLLYRAGERTKAIPHLQRADADDAQAAYLLGVCQAAEAADKGDLPRALQLYRAVTTQHPQQAEGFAELARILVEACDDTREGGQPGAWAAEAERCAARATELDPKRPEPWYLRGRALLFLERSTEAADALCQAVERVATSAPYTRWWAEALLARGDAAGAARAATIALALDGTRAEAWRVLGDAQAALGQRDEAARSLKRALDLAPHSHAVRRSLGHMVLGMGRFADALGILQALPVRTPHDELAVGRCHAAADDFQAALAAYERAHTVAPDLPRLQYHAGCAHAHLGRFDEAIAAFDEELRRAPGDPAPWTQRGHCHLSKGHAANAVTDYRRARELAPHDPSLAYCLARALVATGAHPEALALLQPLLAVWPDDAELQLLVGRLHEATAPLEARRHYERALQLCPGWVKALVRLGVLLCHQGSDAEAAVFLEQAVKSDSTSSEAIYHLGLALGRSGRLGEVAQAWGRLRSDDRLAPSLRRLARSMGANALRAGDPASALKVWEALLVQIPDDAGLRRDMAEAHLQFGLALSETGEARRAAHHLSESVKLDADGHAIANLYLALLPLREDPAEAAARLSMVRLPGPAQARADYHRALALLLAATDDGGPEIDEAMDLLTAAAANPTLEARRYPVHRLLAHALARAGRIAAARAVLARVPDADPMLETYCLVRLGKDAEALAAVERARGAVADHLRGVLLARQQRWGEAAERLARAGDDAQADLVAVLQTWIAGCAGKRDDAGAGEALTVARRLAPDDPQLALYHRALAPHMTMALLRAGRREDAIRSCEQSLRDEPGDLRATHTLGLMYLWWANDLEEKGMASLADTAWEGAIRNLVALSRAESWWQRRREVREKVCGAAGEAAWQHLRTFLLEHLRRRLLDLRNGYANQQRDDNRRRLDVLALRLSLETTSADALAAVMRLCPSERARRLVPCGVSMLKHLRLTESASRLLARARAKGVEASATERLHWCLSKCALSWILIEEKRFEEAIAILQRQVAKSSGSSDVHDLMARALYERGHALLPVAAAADDGQCGAMAAEQALALFRKAKTHVRERKTIIPQIDKAAEDVGVSTATTLLGARVIPAARRAVSILKETQTISNSPRVRENLAEVYAVLGVQVAGDESQPEFLRMHHAKQHLQSALDLNPQNGYARRNMATLMWQEAFAAFKADRYADALDLLLEARTLNPDDEDVPHLLSAVLSNWAIDAWSEGARAEARRMLRDALKFNPENEHARELLGKMGGRP